MCRRLGEGRRKHHTPRLFFLFITECVDRRSESRLFSLTHFGRNFLSWGQFETSMSGGTDSIRVRKEGVFLCPTHNRTMSQYEKEGVFLSPHDEKSFFVVDCAPLRLQSRAKRVVIIVDCSRPFR